MKIRQIKLERSWVNIFLLGFTLSIALSAIFVLVALLAFEQTTHFFKWASFSVFVSNFVVISWAKTHMKKLFLHVIAFNGLPLFFLMFISLSTSTLNFMLVAYVLCMSFGVLGAMFLKKMSIWFSAGWVGLCFALMLLFGGTGMNQLMDTFSAEEPSKSASERKKAIGIRPDLHGVIPIANIIDTLKASQLQDKIVVMDIWATWCKPCIALLPTYGEVFQQYKGKQHITFMAISTDRGEDMENKVYKFVEKKKYTFPVYLDTASAVLKSLEQRYIPFTAVLYQGKVEEVVHAPNSSAYQIALSEAIEKLLRKKEEEEMALSKAQ